MWQIAANYLLMRYIFVLHVKKTIITITTAQNGTQQSKFTSAHGSSGKTNP